VIQYSSIEDVSMQGVWLAIGLFDGVHLGHQKIIRNLTNEARQAGVQTVVLTFHPHPMVFLHQFPGPIYLTTPEKRAELLGRLGVDVVITQLFDSRVADLTARQYLEILHMHLGMRQIWAGYDFAMGKGRQADAEVLTHLGSEFGYTYQIMPAVKVDGRIISSSQIRDLLLMGDVEQAERRLGRPYQVQGTVVRGDGRGRGLGIPTANIRPMEQIVLPAQGVYACWAQVGQRCWLATVNIGKRPTFDTQGKTALTIEAHLSDLASQDDLYGEEMSLDFIKRLRGEMRFSSPEELVAQIQTDIQDSRLILSKKNGVTV
jgi:riboflavin kinase/FMN adenylyltransferase